jgi:hypothetical protein
LAGDCRGAGNTNRVGELFMQARVSSQQQWRLSRYEKLRSRRGPQRLVNININIDIETLTRLDVNECINSPCDQVCVNSPGSYECRCNAGYYRPIKYPETCVKCQVGTYQAIQSNVKWSCDECKPGNNQYQDQEGQTSCKAITGCNAGERKRDIGTAVRNTVCGPCLSGDYQDATGHQSYVCKEKGYCTRGKYATSASLNDPKIDNVCEDCPSGTYQPNFYWRSSVCPPAPGCSAGTYVFKAATPTENVQCRSCNGNGYQTQDDFFGSACIPYATCTPGQYLANWSNTAPGACTACPTDTFQNQAGTARSCKTKQTCGQGQYAESAGSATSDRVCTACTAGKYQPAVSHTEAACLQATACTSGKYTTSTSLSSDTTCGTCASGKFAESPTAAVCTAFQECRLSGSYVETEGTITSDRVCGICAAGTYVSGSTCLPQVACSPGTYPSIYGGNARLTVCSACAAGKYQEDTTLKSVLCWRWQTCSIIEEEIAPGTASSDRVCARKTDECASSPCLNGGTCTDGVQSFTCSCQSGYSGATCNTDVNECSNNPCTGGQLCTNKVVGSCIVVGASYLDSVCRVQTSTTAFVCLTDVVLGLIGLLLVRLPRWTRAAE